MASTYCSIATSVRPTGFTSRTARRGNRARKGTKVLAFTTAPAQETAYSTKRTEERTWNADSGADRGTATLPAPVPLENPADDPLLANPLQRFERLGTGWMGVVVDLEGVLVRDNAEAHMTAWQKLSDEEGKPAPLLFALQRAVGKKNEQVISEVLCWTRDPSEVRRLARRKHELYLELLGEGYKYEELDGARHLLNLLKKHSVPVAIGSSLPKDHIKQMLEELDLASYFDAVVGAEDVSRGRPDPECYWYASQLIERPVGRCVVIGNDNSCTEAAHDAGMKCVSVATSRPLYELSAADLVVRQLDGLSMVNLKALFSQEEGTEPQLELEEEAELQTSYFYD